MRRGASSRRGYPGVRPASSMTRARARAIKTWGGRTVDEQVIREAVSVKSALGENPKRVYGDQKKLPVAMVGPSNARSPSRTR